MSCPITAIFWYTYHSVCRPLNGSFAWSTSPIQCNYLTLGDCRSQKSGSSWFFSVLPGYVKCKTITVFYLLINYYNPVDYNIWDIMEERVYYTSVVWTMSMNWSSALLTSGMVCSRPSLTRLSATGGSDWKLAFMHRVQGRHFEHSWWLFDANLEWKNSRVLQNKMLCATKFANFLVLWNPR